nr:DUF1090 family protein [Pseudomonas sp.]
MPAKPLLILLLAAGLCGGQLLHAASADDCGERRNDLGTQLKEARLQGDKVRMSALEERLQVLNQDCRGVIPLQLNHTEVERANQQANQRETQLREALGAGNPHIIELRREQLDQARRELEAAKR